MPFPKHKHRPCPCGCAEMADECMKPRSALNAFSIGHAIAAYDREMYAQREAERDELPRRDALDNYAATVSSRAHPPNECGDPYDCPIHGEQYRSHASKEN